MRAPIAGVERSAHCAPAGSEDVAVAAQQTDRVLTVRGLAEDLLGHQPGRLRAEPADAAGRRNGALGLQPLELATPERAAPGLLAGGLDGAAERGRGGHAAP